MLSNISWNQYLVTVATLTLLWYVYVYLRFYAGNLKLKDSPTTGQAFQAAPVTNQDSVQLENELETDEESADEFMQVENLIEEIKALLATDSQTTVINTELPADLKKILAKYSDLKYTPYRSAINELILAECERYGTDTIEESDVDGLWG